MIGSGGGPERDHIQIGTLAEQGEGRCEVLLSTEKEQVIAVVGKRGSGKSFTLGVLCEGLCAIPTESAVGRQTRPRATLLFDPLDIYWPTQFLSQESSNEEANRLAKLAEHYRFGDVEFDVCVYRPGRRADADPEWLSGFTLPLSALRDEEWELLLGASLFSEPIGQALLDVLRAQPTDEANVSFANLYSSLDSPNIQSAYHRETLRALRQRLRSLELSGLFSTEGSALTDLLRAGRLSVVMLARLSQGFRAAVIAVLTRMTFTARNETAFLEKRLALEPGLSEEQRESLEHGVANGPPRTVVVLDEAQSFLAPNTPGMARDLFVRLVKEGRNIGLSAIVATQQPSALDRRILSQVETFIVHQLVTEPDIRAVRENLKSVAPTSIEIRRDNFDISSVLRALSKGECLLSAADTNASLNRASLVKIRPRATTHGGIEL